MEFHTYMKKLREERGLSVRELALRSGVSNAYISQMENKKRGTPSPDILKRLAKSLNAPYSDLMERAGYVSKDIPEELEDVGVEWIGLVKELKDQDLTPEYIREIVKLLNRNG